MTTWTTVTGDAIDWLVAQLEALPRAPLGRATVIVPSRCHAHALRRRACTESRQPRLLAGVWITGAGSVAAELCKRSSSPAGGELDAAELLRREPSSASALGSVVVLLNAVPSSALRRFLDALPACVVGELPAAPVNEGGESISREDEVEAAIAWLGEQLTAGVPVEQIALLTTEVDAYAALLSDRMRRLPGGERLGLYVDGGIPVYSTPGGERLCTLFEALASGLAAATTIRLLPALKRGAGDDASGPPRLSLSRAAAVVYGAGIVGGTPGDLEGLRSWIPKLRRRRAALLALIEVADVSGARRNATINRQLAERWLRDVEPILPAVQALQDLGERVVLGASLTELWRGVGDFCRRWVRLPPDPPHLLSLLAPDLLHAADHGAGLAGVAAVEEMIRALRTTRFSPVPFGAPRVFLGTPAAAHGLPFRVRRLLAPGADGRVAHTSGLSLLTPRAVLENAPAMGDGTRSVPPSWMNTGAFDVASIQSLESARRSRDWTAVDGALGAAWSLQSPLGLSPRRPISASAAALLLSCPHRFLFERILRCAPPVEPPSVETIDPVVYGALFHSVAHRFVSTGGAALCRQEGDLGQWMEKARALASEALQALRDVYPLRGAAEVEGESQRLAAQIDAFVRDEWERPRRQFIASELPFGEPEAVALSVMEGEIFLRGSIDRIDRLADGSLSVRDLKTGWLPDLNAVPLNAARDLQIGVYVLIVEAIGLGNVGEAAYCSPHGAQRRFTGAALHQLRQSTRDWLSTVRTLLHKGMFPRTPDPADCRFCSFRSVCGSGAQQRSAAKLAALPAAHPLQGFATFKRRRAAVDSDPGAEGE